jgi:hypothetical protein
MRRSRDWTAWPESTGCGCGSPICASPNAQPWWRGRYAHAKQFNRHRRQLRILRTRLGRIIRDIRRKIAGQEHIAAFEAPLARASQIRSQQQRQRGWKLYSFHAPEVECIGKGKVSAPYEFGVKASIVSVEAVIGHMKNDGHLGRCYLKGRNGDATNVILTAVGYNLRLVLAWLRVLLRLILTALLRSFAIPSTFRSAC